MDTSNTAEREKQIAATRADIAYLNKLRSETTDPKRREELSDDISAIAMGAQFREIEDERAAEEAGKVA